jgi:hypothetical protein
LHLYFLIIFVDSSTSVQPSTSDAGTPNLKTNREIKALGLCAKKNGEVKKRLLFSNVVRHYRGQLSTTIIRKYRCKAAVQQSSLFSLALPWNYPIFP